VRVQGIGEVQGRADSGRVKVSYQGNAMHIYLRHKDADAGTYPLDLREALATLCSIERPTDIRLLDFILSESDTDEILGELRRRGFQLPDTEIAKILETVPTDNILDTEYVERKDSIRVPVSVEGQFRGHTPNTRRYRRRQAETQSADSIQAFLAKFNMANSFREQLAQPWSDAGAENLLAHSCRLEDVDPWNLLPRNRNQWDELLKAKGKPPGVATGTFWSSNRHIQGKNFLGDRRNVRNAYAAVVLQDHRRNMVIKISNAIDNPMTDEALFAAEHYVRQLYSRVKHALLMMLLRCPDFSKSRWVVPMLLACIGQALYGHEPAFYPT
jgi:hypothetical protein